MSNNTKSRFKKGKKGPLMKLLVRPLSSATQIFDLRFRLQGIYQILHQGLRQGRPFTLIDLKGIK